MKSLSQGTISFKTLLVPLFVLGILILMFIFPVSSLNGAKTGLLLWFNTVLPTLLPFIILSNIIIRLNITKYICFLFSPILKKLFHVSDNGCYPIIMGLLSGYPLSAKTCADLVNEGSITVNEGQFLLSLCNNASVMFITSYIAISNLNMPSHQYELLGIIYLSALISAFIYRLFLTRKRIYNQSMLSITECSSADRENTQKMNFKMIDDSILDGFEVITKIGGYIILFSILATIISNLGSSDSFLKLITVGLLEITTGIDIINRSSLEINEKIVLIISVTAFGGFSSLAQTKSVIDQSRLSILSYLKVKILNLIIAFLLSIAYVQFFLSN